MFPWVLPRRPGGIAPAYRAATKILSEHAVSAGALATSSWRELWQHLMVSFIDGSIKTPSAGGTEDCGCTSEHVTYTAAWKEKVVSDAGEHYKTPGDLGATRRAHHDKPTISQLAIKGVLR